jgi:hypothetical protein
MLEVVELSPFLGILLFMPGFNLIVLFLMSLKLGKVFNASFGMKMGLIFLDIVFYPMLAKSNVAYKITNDDYMRALDSARSESINLMTQDEINEMNKVEEPDPFSEVDSIFKSEIKEEFSSEPYKAVKNTQSDNKPAETIAYVDDLFRPIERTEDFETNIDIDVDAFIPATYIRSENHKLNIYKRIATISTEEELSDMTDELMDSFGDIPKSAMNLMKIAQIKSMAHEAYITEIKGNRKEIRIKMFPRAKINPAGIPDIMKNKGSRMRFTNGDTPYFTYYFKNEEIKSTEDYMDSISAIVEEIKGLREGEEQ